ncbi:MAG TPA: glucosamine-6-phosphate deaminase [Chitinophagaceae bacterium]|nr:glucosamine-6-phosphate deaminase [Chitinophagaceae bacterium]
MELKRFKNYHELSDFAASEIANSIKNKPSLVLCFASGDTPKLTVGLLVKKLKEGNIDHSKMTFIGLDEWVGLPPTNSGSCHYFFQHMLIGPLGLQPSQYFLFDALASDLKNECVKMDKFIDEKSGIDVMVVGIGMNGHIGFNEPGTSFDNLSHVIELDEITKSVGQKYFTEEVELSKGITIGFKQLLQAKKVVLMANGSKKAEVIKKTVEGPVTENFPASIMQRHENGFVLVDDEAASLLSKAR